MDKKLPSVFANRIEKDFTNNEKVYFSKSSNIKNGEEKNADSAFLRNDSINQKIRKIFNSRNYIYKAKVEIVQNGKKSVKNIIGKRGNELITLDNEVIPIETIEDIKIIANENS